MVNVIRVSVFEISYVNFIIVTYEMVAIVKALGVHKTLWNYCVLRF